MTDAVLQAAAARACDRLQTESVPDADDVRNQGQPAHTHRGKAGQEGGKVEGGVHKRSHVRFASAHDHAPRL